MRRVARPPSPNWERLGVVGEVSATDDLRECRLTIGSRSLAPGYAEASSPSRSRPLARPGASVCGVLIETLALAESGSARFVDSVERASPRST